MLFWNYASKQTPILRQLPLLSGPCSDFQLKNETLNMEVVVVVILLQQKIVIKVAMPSSRSRAKALAVVAAWDGVYSMEIDGAGMDCVVVVGQGVDYVKLISALRKKMGYADLLEFGPAGPFRRPAQLPARQRFSDPSSGSSSDSDDDKEEEDPHPSSSNNGKGKQSLQVARPHVAIRPDGSSAKGFLGYLCSRFCFANHE